MRANRDATVKLIADLYEIPAEIAGLEYENTILKLETDGDTSASSVKDAVQLSMDLAKLGGLRDIMPREELYSTQFKPVPTKP
jgi:NitT/TauT family transport system substrate-binding protein